MYCVLQYLYTFNSLSLMSIYYNFLINLHRNTFNQISSYNCITIENQKIFNNMNNNGTLRTMYARLLLNITYFY